MDVTNITLTPEMAVWPLRGGHEFLQAERLPKEFDEKFDIVFSHLAFRYMRYRDIALENAIRSLRKGGILSIHLSSDDWMKPGETRVGIDTGIDAQFRRMEELQEQGIIKYLPMVDDKFNDARNHWMQNGKIVYGRVYLQKTGSISSL